MENNFIKNSNQIDGRAIAAALFSDVKARVEKLKFQPLLCDVVAGSDAVSISYVKIKRKFALQCGLDFSLVHLPNATTAEEVVSAIQAEQEKSNLCGLIVQLPLPAQINSDEVLKALSHSVDVDVINPESAEKFYANQSGLVPPTPGAIMYILEQLPIDLSKEKILVLGQGELVGKPITQLLRVKGYAVDVATSETSNKAVLLKQATVIITGVGKAGVLKGDDISDGVVVIDAGTSESAGSIYGDVDFETVVKKAKFITPSPGGVGPVTVAKLLENVLIVAEARSKA